MQERAIVRHKQYGITVLFLRYDANSFVSKNKDLLKPELQQVLDGSSVRMIKSFVQANAGEGAQASAWVWNCRNECFDVATMKPLILQP